jgi:RNA polymerase sigma-70 factor (ECF subfamily)
MTHAMMNISRLGGVRSGNSKQLQSLDDAQLVQQFLRKRDVDAFEILVRRHRDNVFALATSTMGRNSSSEAEDVTQEIFVVVYHRLETFRGDAAFSTWLYRVARNQIAGFRRRPAHRVVTGGEDGILSLADTNKRSDPQNVMAEDDVRKQLLHIVDQLGEPQRNIVHLFYWQERSVGDIAALLELAPNTVKSHLRRARLNIEEALRETDVGH